MSSILNKCVLLSAVAALLAASTAFADGHSRCDRAKRYETLSSNGDTLRRWQLELNQGRTVVDTNAQTDTSFHMGYVYKLIDGVNVNPELLMAVFSTYQEQSSYLRPYITKSEITSPSNHLRAKYTQIVYDLDTQHSFVGLGRLISHYKVLDSLQKPANAGNQFLYWSLLEAWGLGKPTYIDGYMRAQQVGTKTLIIYCNYTIPELPDGTPQSVIDSINSDGPVIMKDIVEKTGARVISVGTNQDLANVYIETYRKLWQ